MKLEEAKKILNKFDNRCKGCIDEEFCEGCYIDNEDVKAIETLLHHVKHLQKENEELKDIDLTIVHLKGVSDEKERWRNKIKKEIEELNKKEKEELKGTKGQDRYFIKQMYQTKINILYVLLKEE